MITNREIAVLLALSENRFYEEGKRREGQLFGQCACMGPTNGEPGCPCEMARYERMASEVRRLVIGDCENNSHDATGRLRND